MGHESLATTAIYVRVPLRMQCSAVNLLPDVQPAAARQRRIALPPNVPVSVIRAVRHSAAM